jgi:hypothetical protein
MDDNSRREKTSGMFNELPDINFYTSILLQAQPQILDSHGRAIDIDFHKFLCTFNQTW